MASYRFAEDADDSILSNGKVMSGLLNETIKQRVMNEAQLMTGNELAQAADAAAAAGKEIVWPHIVQLNGPMVETNEGSKKMAVKGG